MAPHLPHGLGTLIRGPRRCTGRAGFSLPELMAVLTIMGLLAAIAAPRFDTTSYKMDAAVHTVAGKLLGAQAVALKGHHDVALQLDLAGRALRTHLDLDSDGTEDSGEPIGVEPLPEGVVFGIGGAPVPTGLSLNSQPSSFTDRRGRPTVVFHRNGSVSQQGGFYLTSTRAARTAKHPNDTRAVTVRRVTGRPTWHRYEAGAWKRDI